MVNDEKKLINYLGVTRKKSGSGYPFQVLVRTSLWAFLYYPSRKTFNDYHLISLLISLHVSWNKLSKVVFNNLIVAIIV